MSTFPQTRAGIVLTALAGLSLAVSLYFHLPMWEVELTSKKPSAGGGEHLVALLFGLPALIVATIVTAITISRAKWRSRLLITLLSAETLLFLSWLALLVKDKIS